MDSSLLIDMTSNRLHQDGFAVINNLFSKEEVKAIIALIENVASDKSTFRKSADLFAIRQFLKEIPAVQQLILTSKLIGFIEEIFGNGFFVIKAIYFDKPPASNWLVPYHQDLTIAVKEKHKVAGFGPWTVKQNQYGVQPPLSILENIFTIRIHLDDTDENNGALRVIPGSHSKGILKPETLPDKTAKEVICYVNNGGIMLMRPLLLHASGKTVNNQSRRVIHIEFSNQHLPQPLTWAEFEPIHKVV